MRERVERRVSRRGNFMVLGGEIDDGLGVYVRALEGGLLRVS